jgi:membrane protein implicated in regulation of membrane protease activity
MMVVNLITQSGHWSWIVLGLILLVLEVLMPGIFLIWFGAAALVTGIFALLLLDIAGFGWQSQLLLFLILSVVFPLVSRKFFGSSKREVDEPLLNRRGEQLIGQRAFLIEAIVNGHGRLKINDTIWRATGIDMPMGTSVLIIGFDQGTLIVEPAV